MADYQRVVEYLRDARSAPMTVVTDELRQYAVEYADLCKGANERLRRCTTFLQQGLRSEAMQLVEQSPNLLDLVASLDLPDASVWADFCQQFELPAPPPLQMDRAAMLADIYNQDQSVEELLDRHRLLALARAPLRKRLELMRLIAPLDAASGFWEKDIRVFEHTRIKEMRLETQAAISANNATMISELAAELEQNQWREPIPGDLQKAVNDAFTAMIKAEVEGKLGGLLDRLRAAYAAKSHEECAALLQQVREIFDSAGLTAISTPIALEIQPVVQWVQKENDVKAKRDAFTASCAAFGRLIAADAPGAELEAANQKLGESGDEIPPELTQTYTALLGRRRGAARRKRIVYLSLAAGSVAAALVIVYLVLQNQAAEGWAAKIREANAAENTVLAKQLIEEQERRAPRLSSSASIAAAKQKTAEIEKQQSGDHQVLRDLLASILPLKAQAEATAKVEDASPDALATAIGTINVAIGKLESGKHLAWVDSAKQIPAATRELNDLRSLLQKKVSGYLSRQIDALSAQVDAIAADADIDTALATLATVTNKAGALQTAEGMDDSLKSTLAAVLARVEQRKGQLTQTRQLREQLQTLRTRSATADSLKDRLTAFTTQFPAAPQTKDFTAAIERLSMAKAIEAWESMSRSWVPMATATPAAATKRAEALQAYITANPQSPFTPDATAYIAYLKQCAAALDEKSTWRTALGDLLSNPLLSELAYVKTTDGRRFYTIGNIQRKDEPKKGSTFEALDPKNLTKRQTITVPLPARFDTPEPVPLPHVAVVRKLNDETRQVDESNWETWGADAIDHLGAREDIEPAVQGLLLGPLIKTNKVVIEWGPAAAYDRAETALARLELDSIAWYDPDRPVSDSTNAAIRAAIKKLPPAGEMKQKILARKVELFRSLTFRTTGTAILMHNDAGAWTVYAPTNSDEGTVALTVATTAGAPMINVAVVKAGKFEVDANAVRDLPEGMLLFLTAPAEKKP